MSSEAEASQLAHSLRIEHGLGTAPIGDVFEFAHSAARVDVFSMDAHDSEHGLTMLDPGTGRTVIAVATTDNPMRQRSSVAHELCHVLAGDLARSNSDRPGMRSPEEIRADAFARHLLLPQAALRCRFDDGYAVTGGDLSTLVQEYGLSPQMAAIQLREVQLISQATYEAWRTLSTRAVAAQNGWLSQYRGLAEIAGRPRAPQRLMARSAWAYQHGLLSLPELSAWYGQAAEELVEQLGPPEASARSDDGWLPSGPLFESAGP